MSAERTPIGLRTGLLLAAHGELGGGDNRMLHAHAAALRERRVASWVGIGLIKGSPTLAEALAEARAAGCERVLLYPFFMSGGYFAGTVLPRLIAEAGVPLATTTLAPLGLDPGLAEVLLAVGLAAARSGRLEPGATTLLLAAHGSAIGTAPAEATRAMAARLSGLGGFRAVVPAFIEEAPRVGDALAAVEGPVVVAGFFSGEGVHGSRDVLAAIAASGRDVPYTGAIGARPDVLPLIAAGVSRAVEDGRDRR